MTVKVSEVKTFFQKLGPLSLQALLNLLLTGRASPHVFNGTLNFGDGGEPLECPLQGVLSRGDVGYMHWSREQMERGLLPQVNSWFWFSLLQLRDPLMYQPLSPGGQHAEDAPVSCLGLLYQ